MRDFEADKTTPRYAHTVESIKLLYRICIALKSFHSQNDVERMTTEFARVNNDTFKFQNCETGFPQQTYSALKKCSPLLGTPFPDRFRLLWIWLHTEHPELVAEVKERQVDIWDPEELSRSLNGLLTPGSEIDHRRLRQLLGRYLMYRRFYHDTDAEEIMVAELKCGPAINQFSIAMSYRDVGGSVSQDEVHGCIVPYDGGFLFQGTFTKMGGPFVFVITLSHGGRSPIKHGDGVLLAAASGVPASSYPILIIRSENSVGEGVISAEDLKKDKMTWRLFENTFRRGKIDWR